MKTIYFIDNESIKRTAKAIQKTNPTFKHTVILDDLATVLGYKSYNQYEHYLTNAMLSQKNNLNTLKALTKIDALSLLDLSKKFIVELSQLGYSVDNLYFINKLIENQRKGYLEHPHLDLRSYVYYLPFVFESLDIIDGNGISLINYGYFHNIIQIVIDECNKFGFDNILKLVNDIKSVEDYSTDSVLVERFESLSRDLKTRGIYYYIKSIIEDFEYDEGYLTKLILDGFSIEKIAHYLKTEMDKERKESMYYTAYYTPKEITVFYKNDKHSILNEYFPFIKASVTANNPFVLGRHIDQTPFFATFENLHSNISLLGVPGSGKGAFLYSFMFQLMMNNRGFCVINPIDESYLSKFCVHMSNVLNKKNDIFFFNEYAPTKSISSAIHNDKFLFVNCAKLSDSRLKIDIHENGLKRFEKIITDMTDYFFTAKFRNKKIPYYIFVDDSQYLRDITPNIAKMIKKLNDLNIFFIFDNQVHEDYINDLCKVTLVSNSCLQWFKNSKNFEFGQLMKSLEQNKDIIGKVGPSKKHPPVFSIVQKGEYVGQFITEIDDELLSALMN